MGLSISADTLIRFLEEHGYRFVRQNGTSHRVYSNGRHSVPVMYHKGKELDVSDILVVLRECKIEV